MKGFNVVVDLSSQSGRPCNEFKSIITDQIGKHISMKLKTRAMIAFENGEIPFCVYDKGVKVKDMKEYYQDYFIMKSWLPFES